VLIRNFAIYVNVALLFDQHLLSTSIVWRVQREILAPRVSTDSRVRADHNMICLATVPTACDGESLLQDREETRDGDKRGRRGEVDATRRTGAAQRRRAEGDGPAAPRRQVTVSTQGDNSCSCSVVVG